MKRMEKLFALKVLRCFGQLSDSELAIVADIAVERVYKPGESLCRSDTVLESLYVVVEGAVRDEQGAALPEMIGPASLLFGIPTAGALNACHEEGAVCLVVSKAHFFTLIHECPALLLGLLEFDTFEVDPSRQPAQETP